VSSATACASSNEFYVYSLCPTITTTTCKLYYVQDITQPVDAGYYADKDTGDYYRTTDASGTVTTVASC
jgi:hypothetical protein